jgi:hypothetical protein
MVTDCVPANLGHPAAPSKSRGRTGSPSAPASEAGRTVLMQRSRHDL